jgi:hypothetical protein
MNYQKHYDTLMNRAKNRLLEGYSERHHIIPRCMGGTDEQDNLVALTAEEHYVAHQLLVKMYPDNDKLIYAAKMMTISGSDNIRNNKLYGWLRVKFSASMKELLKNNPEKHPMNSPEAKAKRSVFMKEFLKNNPEKNPSKNPETRAKISASMTEYYNNPEARAKQSASTKKYLKNNPEARAKMSASRKEFLKNNPEKNPSKNPEARAKISASKKELYKNNPEKNPSKNPETRAKMSASMKEYHRKKKLANG